jgi:hypothetical protein
MLVNLISSGCRPRPNDDDLEQLSFAFLNTRDCRLLSFGKELSSTFLILNKTAVSIVFVTDYIPSTSQNLA